MSRYPEPGEVLLGKYRVESLIGEGGMGAVIKARHLDLEEYVAIKCLLPEMMSRKDIVARFIREAKAAVKLKGEHVARVLDVGRFENHVPYIVMEYLEGADLSSIIKHYGAQELTISVDLMLQACEAIAEAHSLGIIHRDIKASNFFIAQPEGQAPNLKVLDFGIATAPEGTSDLTSTQSVIGTPAYMAPEQMRSSRTADARSDIWSMGVVLYELLEGDRPFRSEAYSELCLKVGMDPPHPMENPAVPDALREVVMTCLEKSVERRYQSVAELAFDLMPFASDAVAARTSVEQCARLLGRRGSKVFNTPRPESVPPGSEGEGVRVHRLTPRSAQHAVPSLEGVRTPTSSSQDLPKVPTVLGRPTPTSYGGRPKTPTSINKANGEISSVSNLRLLPQRRVIWMFAAAVVVLGGGAGAYAMLQDDDAAVAVSPATGGSATEAPIVPVEYNPRPEPIELAAPVELKLEEVQALLPEIFDPTPAPVGTAIETAQVEPRPEKAKPAKSSRVRPVKKQAAVKTTKRTNADADMYKRRQ